MESHVCNDIFPKLSFQIKLGKYLNSDRAAESRFARVAGFGPPPDALVMPRRGGVSWRRCGRWAKSRRESLAEADRDTSQAPAWLRGDVGRAGRDCIRTCARPGSGPRSPTTPHSATRVPKAP